jgi:hypothetical protein
VPFAGRPPAQNLHHVFSSTFSPLRHCRVVALPSGAWLPFRLCVRVNPVREQEASCAVLIARDDLTAKVAVAVGGRLEVVHRGFEIGHLDSPYLLRFSIARQCRLAGGIGLDGDESPLCVPADCAVAYCPLNLGLRVSDLLQRVRVKHSFRPDQFCNCVCVFAFHLSAPC